MPTILSLRSVLLCCIIATPLLYAASATEYYVDNVRGSDTAPGTSAKPFQTIEAGVNALKGGDSLHLVPNEQPYTGIIQLGNGKGGTPEQPTVIDGHGALLSRLTHYAADQWKDEGGGVFSMKLRHNAVAMSHQGYWSGFPFIFLDGKRINWVKTREELTPQSYLFVLRWYPETKKHDPLHGTLFVRLPAGKTPAEIKIEAPGYNACIVETSNVTVKNLCVEWCSADAFDTCWGKGIVFENVRGSYCIDQCISNHSADRAIIRYSSFDHAADGGILDINMNKEKICRVKYIGCILENNVHLGGAGFHGGEYEMESCIIRNNDGAGVFVSQGAKVTLRNCYIKKGTGTAKNGITVNNQAALTLEDCTVEGFPTGLLFGDGRELKIIRTVFSGCATALNLAAAPPAGTFLSRENLFTTGSGFLWEKEKAATLKDFLAKSGSDIGSAEIPASAEETFSYLFRHPAGNATGSQLDPRQTLEELALLLSVAAKTAGN